jgi:hypothetical protein
MKSLTIIMAGLVLSLSASTLLAQSTSGNANTQTDASAKTGKVNASTSESQQTNAKASKNGKSSTVNSSSSQNSNASANVGSKSLNLDSGSQIEAALNSTLDTKHAQNGQQFTMKTTKDVKSHGQTVVKKGSTLVGHVVNTQSKAEGNGSSNMLLAIDGVQPQGGSGQLIPLQATFAGVIRQTTQAATDMDMSSPMTMPSTPRSSGGGGGLLGGVGGAVNSTVRTTTQTVGGVTNGIGGTTGSVTNSVNSTVNGTVNGAGNVAGGAALNGTTQTLFSLGNGITASTSGTVQGATQFSRKGGDLKLDKGSEFLLSVVGSGQATGSVQK